MNYALRTFSYFVVWGTFYGFMLGTWSGTMIYPGMGTYYTLFWGPGIGAACGVLSGLLVAGIQARTFHPDVDLDVFRRRLMLGIGLLVAVAGSMILIATSRGILWNIDDYGIIKYMYGKRFLVMSLISVTVWGSLAAAYVAQAYPAWLADLKTNQTHASAHDWPVSRLMGAIFLQAAHPGTLASGAIAGIIQHFHNVSSAYSLSTPDQFNRGVEGAVLGISGTIIIVLMLAFAHAALLVFLKKTIFSEDVLPLSPEALRSTLTGLSAVLTGLWIYWFHPSVVPMVTLMIIVLTSLYIYKALPHLDADFDKTKRKEATSQLMTE
jgi:hypothetical protein